MTAICEKKLHKAQKRLRGIILDLEAMRLECCDTDQCCARDTLGEVVGHLYMAQAKGGGICMNDADGNEVRPMSGGKRALPEAK